MYKAYNGEMLWEGEDMESAYMVISHIISRKCRINGLFDRISCRVDEVVKLAV